MYSLYNKNDGGSNQLEIKCVVVSSTLFTNASFTALSSFESFAWFPRRRREERSLSSAPRSDRSDENI